MSQIVKFKLKYVPDIFADVNTELERGFEAQLTRLGLDIEEQQTESEWAATYDLTVKKRTKEVLIQDRWKCEIFQFHNADMLLVAASEMVELLLYDDNGTLLETWSISNCDASIANEGEQLYNIIIKFTKNVPNPYSYPLASDNLMLKYNNGGFPCNKIKVYHKNPGYQQRCKIEFVDVPTGYRFKFTANDLTNNIQVGECYYVHFRKYDVEKYFDFAAVQCSEKTASYITFIPLTNGQMPNIGDIYDTVTINNEISRTFNSNIQDKMLVYDIYIGLHKKLDNDEKEGEKIRMSDNEEVIDSMAFMSFYRVPFFLKLDELWKYKYLKTASKIEYYELRDVNDIESDFLISTTENCTLIATQSDVDYYGQKEFLLKFPYENLILKVNQI